MRPPITPTTLQQQNEGSRQQQQVQQLQQQFQNKTSDTTTLQTQPQSQQHQQQQQQITRKAKLTPHDLLVEKQLNSACNSAPQTTTQTQPQQQALIKTTPHSTQPILIARKTGKTKAPLPTAQQQHQRQQTYQASRDFDTKLKQRNHRLYTTKQNNEEVDEEATVHQNNDIYVEIGDDNEGEEFTVQLVDLSTSPPSPPPSRPPPLPLLRSSQSSRSVEGFQLFNSQTSPTALQLPKTTTRNHDTNTQRSSIISDCQYSTQSSASSDDVSLSFQYNLESFNSIRHQQQHKQLQQQQEHHYTRANSFDDAAKHFIINFPGDSVFEQRSNNQNDCVINLPLSETEPLLTKIETTVADKKRSICLHKNSASLIFTKKELPQRATSVNERRFFTAPITATNNNQPSQQHQHQQQQQQQTNKHSTNLNLNTTQQRCHSLRANHHSTNTITNTTSSGFSVNSATTTNRRPTKHLPATYNQQQRRSLQLNYNNNLVTTTTCSANNNNCCPSSKVIIKSSNGGSANAALHRPHSHRHSHTNASTPTPPTTSSGVNESRTTAATTRKQHAYSWYAPVYSALEEELEQDSRDSSPIHNNLANTKKHLTTTHYPHRPSQKHSTTTSSDNETVALLETRNQINIQAQLHAQQSKGGSNGGGNAGGSISIGEGLPAAQRKGNASAQALTLQLNSISGGAVGQSVTQNYDHEGPHAGSLGLAGGPLPRRKRLENLEKFFKSLVGLRPSSNSTAAALATAPVAATAINNTSVNLRSNNGVEYSTNPMPPLPSSPEIRITRTPSDQNVDMSDAERQLLRRSQDKLAPQPCHPTQGSSSSLNVVQQKLWNIIRRDNSAASLYQDKSQSLVQYSGLRKCETVLALTSRQGNPPYSPVNGVSGGCLSPHYHHHHHPNGCSGNCICQAPYMGSGVFSANGVEQIRPLNRLRNSMASINNGATCSRCSSLLSLAASGSRYSLNTTANGFVHSSASHQLLATMPQTTTFHLGSHAPQPQRRYTASGMVRHFSFGSRRSCSGSSRDDGSPEPNGGSQRKISACSMHETPSVNVPQHKISTCSMHETHVPLRKISACSYTSSSGVSRSRKSSAGTQSNTTNRSISPPSNQTTATFNSSLTPSSVSTALATTATSASLSSTPTSPTVNNNNNSIKTPAKVVKHSPSSADLLTVPLSPASARAPMMVLALPSSTNTASTTTTKHELQSDSSDGYDSATLSQFQMFTCKLCLIDVESVKEATTLIQCGCQFCTECMKAYIEFEISEGAYEISCPDAQCPAQGVITLPEIANLTTANLMKKHHRYRLNREIELDKTRTWCPRAGCETVCRVGVIPELEGGDGGAPSTSTAASNTPTSPSLNAAANGNNNNDNNGQKLRCSVLCPSCMDEFCSACKKTWHPNMTCEENSRRLVADGQDDIGIPFDNDLIKCCPMCAVPIEKDEGCAQMMCKRCKHVFCWYCLASLDDDFLLRHYDKGPCKNKLGHSRASVVWHRAQVIGIFAGFGILLLVASPLLLLAAPCIICCKCRSCSSKIDEGDAELEEATQLQSF